MIAAALSRIPVLHAVRFLALNLLLTLTLTAAPRPLYVYDFGGLEKLQPEARVEVAAASGFAGLVLSVANSAELENLPRHLARCTAPNGPRILAVFVRFSFVDTPSDHARCQEVVRLIAGRDIALWVILGTKNTGHITLAEAEAELKTAAQYAIARGVPVALYPHSKCVIANAEAGFALVEKINLPQLKLVLHLCHELRAGNGPRLPAVIATTASRVSAISISGAAAVIDTSAAGEKYWDPTTVRPLDESEFSWQNFIAAADAAGLNVPVAFINFKIPGDPAQYLPRSLAAWRTATGQ